MELRSLPPCTQPQTGWKNTVQAAYGVQAWGVWGMGNSACLQAVPGSPVAVLETGLALNRGVSRDVQGKRSSCVQGAWQETSEGACPQDRSLKSKATWLLNVEKGK